MEQELLFKYFRGETTKDEETTILEWIEKDSANRREYRMAYTIFAGLALYAPRADSAAMKPQKRPVWRRITRYALQTAALVALVVGAAYVGKSVYRNALSRQETVISVPAGQRMQITLADGSQIQLNSGAVLEYPVLFAGKSRRVKLSGEAMFEVSHDARRPFIVETFASDIQVLGTKFNVQAYADCDRFSTTLVEGTIKVTNRFCPEDAFILHPNDVVTLSNGRLHKTQTTNFAELCWVDGLIYLKRMPFEELMNTFKRAFDVKIVIDRETMPELNVMSGEIRISDGVEHALYVLQQVSTGFSYSRDEKTNEIIIK